MIPVSEIIEKIRRKVDWHVLRHIQRFFTGYSYDMAWDPNYHMAKKVYPIFKRYAEIPPHGAPTHTILSNERDVFVERFGEDRIVAYLRCDGSIDEELETAIFARWKEIIDHVLFSLQFVAVRDEDYPEELYDPNPSYNPNQREAFSTKPVEGKSGLTQLIFNEDYGKTKPNMPRLNEFEIRVSKGFELLGKYWRSFWD